MQITLHKIFSSIAIESLGFSILSLRRASSLVYWTGWLVEGKGNRQKIVDAVMETLRFETWLDSNQQRLFDALGFA
jgi:homoserine kinase type II